MPAAFLYNPSSLAIYGTVCNVRSRTSCLRRVLDQNGCSQYDLFVGTCADFCHIMMPVLYRRAGTGQASGSPCVPHCQLGSPVPSLRRLCLLDLINHNSPGRIALKPRLRDGCYSVTICRAHLTSPLVTEDPVACFTVTSCHESAAAPSIRGDRLLICEDSLVHDNRRDVASQHGEIVFPALCPEYIISFTMCASYLAFYVNDAVVVRRR